MPDFKTRRKDKQVFPTGEGKEYRREDDYISRAKNVEDIDAYYRNKKRVTLANAGFQKRLEGYTIRSMEKDDTINDLSPAHQQRIKDAKSLMKRLGVKGSHPDSVSLQVNRMTFYHQAFYDAYDIKDNETHTYEEYRKQRSQNQRKVIDEIKSRGGGDVKAVKAIQQGKSFAIEW